MSSFYRREALNTWKRKFGIKATYGRLVRIFERAGYKRYADEVRRIAQLSDSETDDSSGSGEDQSQLEQPQTYPSLNHKQMLSQSSPAMSKPTETYVIINKENLPEGKTDYENHIPMFLLLFWPSTLRHTESPNVATKGLKKCKPGRLVGFAKLSS